MVLLDRVRVVGVVDVLAVGLVDHDQHVTGDAIEERVQLRARVHRPRRVVRVADEDEPRLRRDRLEHRVEVVPVVPERHLDRDRAELGRVDRVGGERRPAADDLVARIERRLRQAVDQPVRAGADGDLLEGDAVALGERGPQPPGAAVGIAVEVGDDRCSASTAAGNGPNGPSFDASLTHRASPSSRCTSSTGFPGSYGTRPWTAGRKKLSAISATDAATRGL